MPLAAEASSNNTVLILATARHRHGGPADHLAQGAPVPRPDPRLGRARLVAGFGPSPTVESFTKGVGSTVGSVGLLIALGAMIGGLLADSGGADRIVQTIVERVTPGVLPWAMAGAAALVGIPLFFEVGVVLLVPIVLLVGRRTDVSLLRWGSSRWSG